VSAPRQVSPSEHSDQTCGISDQEGAASAGNGAPEQPLPLWITGNAELLLVMVTHYCHMLAAQPHEDRVPATTELREWWIQWRAKMNAMVATADGAALAAANGDLSLAEIAPFAHRSRGAVHRQIQRYHDGATDSTALPWGSPKRPPQETVTAELVAAEYDWGVSVRMLANRYGLSPREIEQLILSAPTSHLRISP